MNNSSSADEVLNFNLTRLKAIIIDHLYPERKLDNIIFCPDTYVLIHEKVNENFLKAIFNPGENTLFNNIIQYFNLLAEPTIEDYNRCAFELINKASQEEKNEAKTYITKIYNIELRKILIVNPFSRRKIFDFRNCNLEFSLKNLEAIIGGDFAFAYKDEYLIVEGDYLLRYILRGLQGEWSFFDKKWFEAQTSLFRFKWNTIITLFDCLSNYGLNINNNVLEMSFLFEVIRILGPKLNDTDLESWARKLAIKQQTNPEKLAKDSNIITSSESMSDFRNTTSISKLMQFTERKPLMEWVFVLRFFISDNNITFYETLVRFAVNNPHLMFWRFTFQSLVNEVSYSNGEYYISPDWIYLIKLGGFQRGDETSRTPLSFEFLNSIPIIYAPWACNIPRDIQVTCTRLDRRTYEELIVDEYDLPQPLPHKLPPLEGPLPF